MKYAASFVCYIALFSTLVLLPPVVSGQTGKLKTKIQPPEAAVWVDGKYMGHADEFNGPGQTLALPAGEHEVKISLVYYQDHKTTVTSESNKTAVIKQQLRPSDEKRPNPPFAKAKLRCKPTAHAAVIVNGRFIGHCDEMNGPGSEPRLRCEALTQTILWLPCHVLLFAPCFHHLPWRSSGSGIDVAG